MRILLVLLVFFLAVSGQQLTQIQLSTQIQGSLGLKQRAFYSISVPSTLQPNSVLIATVDVVQDHVAPEVFMSSTNQFPDYYNSDEQCLADRIGSCTTANLTPSTSMYISVFCLDGCNFTLFVNIQPTIPISINTRSKIDFNTSSSGILTFVLNDSFTQFTVLAEEQDFYASNHFRMLVGIGFIPSQNNYSLACIDIGPYRKAIKFTDTDLVYNTTYYLLIQAEQNTTLYLDTQAYLPGEQGTILPNTTMFDYLNEKQNYTISYKLTDESVKQPLYIRLKTYSGYGGISVTHCNQHKFFYYDSDGQNEQIRISPKERQECQNRNMLMIENIEIEVIPLMSTYSFSIGSRESSYTSEVRFAEYESGALGSGEYTNYTLNLYLEEPTNISLNIWSDKGDPTFTLSLCENDTSQISCDQIQVLNTEGNVIVPYDPKNCSTKCFLQLDVIGGTQQSQFSFIYRASGYRMKLDDGSIDIGFISMNEYIYYNLTLTNATNVKSITIKVVEYSGEVSLIGSRVVTNPKIDDATTNKDVIMNWNDLITFDGSPEQPIYLSVFGQTEAAYKISVIVNRQENTPSIYTSLEEEATNEFVTNGQAILVKYAPSVNPYFLTFYPYVPKCVIYGSTLPLGTECMTVPEQFTGQLYMNITGVVGQILKIVVSSQTFLLFSNNPFILNCDDTCAQKIRVKIQNSSIGVMHSGYGRLYDHSTNRSISNGQITITCPNNKTVCEYQLSAELNWGEMIVSVSTDDIFQISWYPRPVSLSNLPKKLIYKLPKYVPSVITIVSKIASVDLYANIQMLQNGHNAALDYPNKTSYDFKVQSDFFKRTLSLEITNSLQKDLGCFSDNKYCVVTIMLYLNNHCRYAHIVSDEIFLISASSYTMDLQQNIKYLMEDISQLEYYQYRATNSQNFTFYIEPVSNCKPYLIYSDEIDYPTDQLKTISSYHSISLTGLSKAVVGVVSQTDCMYNMMVLIDNVTSNHRVLIEGFPETINLPKNSTSYFYYQSPSKIPFQISGTISNLPIYVLQVPDGQDPSTYLPTKDINNYSAPHLPLSINNSKPSTYMIAIVNTFPTNISNSLLITQQGLQVIMFHNRVYYQKTTEDNTYRFRYYSANSFLVVFVTSSGSFVVNISGYPDVNVSKVMNDTSSESSIQVTADGVLKPYWIEITAQTMGYFSIEIIETGGQSNPTLTAGLPYFDAFTENPQSNCYSFKGDPTNTENMRISLIYKEEFIKSLEAKNLTLKQMGMSFVFGFKPYGDPNDMAQTSNFQYFALGATVTFTQKYGLYSFCFQNAADELIDEPYYVVLASKELQFLIPSISFFVSDTNAQLDKYEFIATEPKTIIAELMNCEGQTQLAGTSNYSDILDGVTTQIHDDFKNGPYYAGLFNVSKGYYYLGAKALQSQSSYILRFTSFDQTQKIILSEMNMGDTNLKWVGDNLHLLVNIEALQCPKNKCNLTKYVKYYLYMSQNTSSLNKRTRCGIRDAHRVLLFERIQTNLSQNNISFKIPVESIPKKFALSVRAEAVQMPESSDPRSVHYFYNTTQMLQASQIDFNDSWFSFEAMILTMIVMLLVLIFFLMCICKRYKIGLFRSARAVEFEITDFNNNSRQPEPEINTERNQNNQIQLRQVQRRKVDDEVAYGEFIDQSRI